MIKRILGVIVVLLLTIATVVPVHAQTRPEARSGHDLVWHDKLGMVLLVNGDHRSDDRQWAGQKWAVSPIGRAMTA